MKFGILKSKIEDCLVESYRKDTLKRNMFVFEELVLKNKTLSTLYFLYDELSKNKGLNESIVNDYINESIVLFENTVSKVDKNDLKELNMWVDHIVSENRYEDIDNLFSSNVSTIEEKLKSKKTISENLKKSPEQEKEVIEVPLNSMVKIANDTIKTYIDGLNESEKKQLNVLLSTPDEKLNQKYDFLKEDVIEKLETLLSENEDSEVTQKINETINKLQTEGYDKINYFKLDFIPAFKNTTAEWLFILFICSLVNSALIKETKAYAISSLDSDIGGNISKYFFALLR